METIQDLVHYWNYLIPHNPLIEWGRINYDLNKLYKQYGIGDDKYGINVKNTARHFTGGALGKKFYGNDLTFQLADLKENADDKRDDNKMWHAYDTFIDKVNNQRGMAYSFKNPNASRQDIYRAAIEQAIKNYKADYP